MPLDNIPESQAANADAFKLLLKISFYTYSEMQINGMVHLICKLHLKAAIVCVKYNGAISLAQKCIFKKYKVGMNLQKISVRSQEIAWQFQQKKCLTIPKKVHGNPKKDAWKLTGTFSGISSEIPTNMPDN